MDIALAYRCQLLPDKERNSRARILEAIALELAIEDINRTNRRREALARLAIGLPPFRRTTHVERCR
jgi:hypothetical protein